MRVAQQKLKEKSTIGFELFFVNKPENQPNSNISPVIKSLENPQKNLIEHSSENTHDQMIAEKGKAPLSCLI